MLKQYAKVAWQDVDEELVEEYQEILESRYGIDEDGALLIVRLANPPSDMSFEDWAAFIIGVLEIAYETKKPTYIRERGLAIALQKLSHSLWG